MKPAVSSSGSEKLALSVRHRHVSTVKLGHSFVGETKLQHALAQFPIVQNVGDIDLKSFT